MFGLFPKEKNIPHIDTDRKLPAYIGQTLLLPDSDIFILAFTTTLQQAFFFFLSFIQY